MSLLAADPSLDDCWPPEATDYAHKANNANLRLPHSEVAGSLAAGVIVISREWIGPPMGAGSGIGTALSIPPIRSTTRARGRLIAPSPVGVMPARLIDNDKAIAPVALR